jgi:hypothetical protein
MKKITKNILVLTMSLAILFTCLTYIGKNATHAGDLPRITEVYCNLLENDLGLILQKDRCTKTPSGVNLVVGNEYAFCEIFVDNYGYVQTAGIIVSKRKTPDSVAMAKWLAYTFMVLENKPGADPRNITPGKVEYFGKAIYPYIINRINSHWIEYSKVKFRIQFKGEAMALVMVKN